MKKLRTPILASIFTLILIEIGIQVYLIHLAPESVFNQYASFSQLKHRFGQGKLVPHRYLGYTTTPDYLDPVNRHNSSGFRGEDFDLKKPDEVFRIVCLGGSTTYSTGVEDYRLSYPYLLQERLNEKGFTEIEVINAGVPGFGSLETMLNYKIRVKQLKPDLLVVYHGINDIMARLVWPSEAYTADNSGYRDLSFHKREISIWEHSALIRGLLIYAGQIESHQSLTQIDPNASTSVAVSLLNQLRGDKPLEGIFESPGLDSLLALNQPVFFEENLRDLIDLADSENTEVLFVSFLFDPAYYQNKNNDLHHVIDKEIEKSNRVQESLTIELGAHFLDLASKAEHETNLHTDGIHFTKDGNLFRARELAERISEIIEKE